MILLLGRDEPDGGNPRKELLGFRLRHRQARYANEYGAPEGIPRFRNFGIASHLAPVHHDEACDRNPD
jgi:hypothetical protein